KKIRGAALDVYANEPPADGTTFESPLCDLPNVIGTHHIGASTEQAQMAVAAETVRIVREYKTTGKAPNCINLQTRSQAKCMLVVRLANQPGSLAHVFQQLSKANINVEEMDHAIYDGGQAACAQINLDQVPPEPVLVAIRTGHAGVLAADVSAA
ncbi:MAG: hydroxyacid dehydrogenase, partial [Deltaproteobacteria bacterium]|nr:hydroxyacid dehydrogenase [Deltaproteobacteria bacterium]